MKSIVEVLEVLLLVSLHVDVGLRLVDVHAGGTPVVREVLVESQPGPLGWSAGGGGGARCGGGGRRCSGCSGRGHIEGGLCALLRPVVHLSWPAVVGEVDVDLREKAS